MAGWVATDEAMRSTAEMESMLIFGAVGGSTDEAIDLIV